MTEALYTHNAYTNVYGCSREKMPPLSARMGFEIGSGAAYLSEVQIPILEPGTDGEEVMPAPKDPAKLAEFSRIISESNKRRRPAMLGKCHSEESKQKMSASHKGANNHMFGVRHSEEARRKMSDAKKGVPMSSEARIKISEGHKGLHPSEETRKKLSAAKSGKNSPLWKGGLSFEPYCPKFNNEFKERVRAFFGYRCVECGSQQIEKKLSIHHVNFNKKTCCDDTIPLFVALCIPCHAKTNYNRDYWQRHFTDMITSKHDGKCYFTKEEMTKCE